MKQNFIKLIVFLCFSGVLLAALFIIAGQIQEEPPEDNLEQTQPTTEPTTPSEPQSPTDATEPVLEENPFASSDFVREGEWMTCKTADYALGVDVSKHQGQIDWQKVADSGVEFAIIRVGGRGYGQAGNLFVDEMAQENYAAAKAAGLQVGAYFFSQAISVEEAQAEAAFILDLVKDWQLDLPVVFDWEYISDTARTANTDAETVTACAKAFCQAVTAAGRQAMVYIRPEQSFINPEELAEFSHWVALYSDTMDYSYSFTMWQYTNTGTVPGISGNADINILIKADA